MISIDNQLKTELGITADVNQKNKQIETINRQIQSIRVMQRQQQDENEAAILDEEYEKRYNEWCMNNSKSLIDSTSQIFTNFILGKKSR